MVLIRCHNVFFSKCYSEDFLDCSGTSFHQHTTRGCSKRARFMCNIIAASKTTSCTITCKHLLFAAKRYVGKSNRSPCQQVGRCHTRGESHGTYIMYASTKCKEGCPLRLWNPEKTSPEVQNKGISGLIKRACVHLFLKKDFEPVNWPVRPRVWRGTVGWG